MRRVRSTNTTTEKKVRSLLHRLGFRFRLHRRDLPGKPDIVLRKYSTVVFVHGCFWHRHPGCPRTTIPATRQDYWLPKFEKTVDRDRRNLRKLHQLGWNVVVVWECELRNDEELRDKLKKAITKKRGFYHQDVSSYKMAAETKVDYRSS